MWGKWEYEPVLGRALAVVVLFAAGVAVWFWHGGRGSAGPSGAEEVARATYGTGKPRPSPDGGGGRSGPWARGPGRGADSGGGAASRGGQGPEARRGQEESLAVHVAGAVRRPGVYLLREGARVQDALAAAGGATPAGRPDVLNLAARLADGTKVYVPTAEEVRRRGLAPWEAGPWEAAFLGGAALDPAGASGGGRPGAGNPPRVDVNRATEVELDALPGIGPSLARRIVEYRGTHGPFRRIEDLLQVPGIGPARLQELRTRLTVR